MKGVSCVTQLSCVKPVTNVKKAAQNLSVGARLQNYWQTWLDLGVGPKVVQILREGYTLPFRTRPRLARSHTIVSCYVNPHRNSYLLEALHQPIHKNAVELVKHKTSLSFFNRLFLVPKPNNQWRPILDLSNLNFFLKAEKFKMETPETIRTSLRQGVWVTSIDFKDAYFHIPIQEQSRKYVRFHFQGQTYQFKALPFGLSTAPLEFTVVVKVKLMASNMGIRIHQYLDDWLVRATSHQDCLQHTQDLVGLCQRLGWIVNLEKVGAGAQTNLRFCRLPVRPQGRSGPTHTGPVAASTGQITRNIVITGLSSPAIHVSDRASNSYRETSLPRPPTYETHSVASKEQLADSGNTRKSDPYSQLPAPPLRMVARRRQRSLRPTFTPHELQLFTDASKEGWGAHLNEYTARGVWSLPESKLHINYLELKAVFLALKDFQDLCASNIVLIASDNTTVVWYINKEGGMKSCPLCALLWRILTWCTRKQVTLRARHIPGRLNVVADKLSCLGQTIQTEWSLLPEVFQSICYRWHRPQIDLFAVRFNRKLPQFVTPVPDPLATAVDALSLPWEDLDAYAFPPAAILGKVVEKLQDSPCKRIILIAPGWPNMPWFWNLVIMSSQIPLSLPNLPNLLTQPFNQIPHRNLTNLNFHAWLLELQQSRSRASLKQWQQGLRLLKENQPDQSMRQSGPFLKVVHH